MKNDPHTEHRNEAIKIRDKYHRVLNKLTQKARVGDNNAAKQIIVELTNYHKSLKEIGYRTTSEDEPGKAGRVVARTQEWIDNQKAKETQRDRDIKAFRKASMDGDKEAQAKFLRLIVVGVE